VYFLTPREVTATTAYLSVIAVDEAKQAKLSLAPNLAPLPKTLETWPPGKPARLRHCEVKLTGLKPRQSYSVALLADGKPLVPNVEVKFTTLPAELPLLDQGKPFTVLLGSCFARAVDNDGKVGKTVFHMPHSAAPDIKLLAGDQVYLDSPFEDYLFNRFSHDELRNRFLKIYVSTWSQSEGFGRLLRDGANFFCSDDHEYWNNAPNIGTLWANTYWDEDRAAWLEAAQGLFRAFQTPRPLTRFDVPPLSFLIADTRINRDADEAAFMPDKDLAQVGNWVKSLKGPGVLVIGQPLLWPTSSWWKGHGADWNLPDYKQYATLVEIVSASPHSLIILTGDVHFARIAHGPLKSGGELVEIISSPMSLISKGAAGDFKDAPPTFPVARSDEVTGELLARNKMTTDESFKATDGHFLTLEFTRQGPGARLNVRYWPVFKDIPPSDFGKPVWNRTFT
jgi:hypothetical protein